MKQSQSGFTLIELVVVIVLLGILGATALGKFQDLSGEASTAAVEGVASELSAASSVNYAKSLVSTTTTGYALGIGASATGGGASHLDTTSGKNACNSTALANLMTSGFPSGYTLTADTTGKCANHAGDTYTCTITGKNTKTAKATLVCTE